MDKKTYWTAVAASGLTRAQITMIGLGRAIGTGCSWGLALPRLHRSAVLISYVIAAFMAVIGFRPV
jgi:L-asparagine transporter-like permease